MNDGTTKTYEMLWDCEYCGAKKLLGKTHRHCPECGAAQNPDKRYFPEEHEKVAVEDHQYFGADVHCPACKAPNSARAKFCAECGSPMEEGGRVALKRDPMAPPPGAAPPARKSGVKVWPFVVGGIVLLLIAGICVALFWKKTVAITTTGHTWEREVKIESFETRSKSAWCDLMPGDARGVRRAQEVRSHRDVPDGQECSTRRVDNGDGTYSQKQECRTKYRKEPVYDAKCYFSVDRWEYERSIKAAGRSLAEVPVWPQVVFRKQGVTLGSEREGGRVETYLVHFVDVEQATSSCAFPQAKWQGVPVGSQWAAEAAVLTGILDCDSLRPPGQ